jgi:hypothetical protein
MTLILLPSFDSSFPNAFPIVPACNFTNPGLNPPTVELYNPVGHSNILIPMASLIDVYNSTSRLDFSIIYGPNRTYINSENNKRLYQWSQLPRKVKVGQTDTFWLVGYYSQLSLSVNYVLQYVGTICMVGSMEHASTPVSYFSKRTASYFDFKYVIRFIFLGLMFMSFLSGILITPIDHALLESQKFQGVSLF